MRIKRVDIPIYYGYLVIIVTKSDGKDFLEVAKKYNLADGLENFGAFVWHKRNKIGVSEHYICVDEKVSNHLIAHEVVHLVNGAFIDRMIQLDPHNDEPQAYLTGWFFNEI